MTFLDPPPPPSSAEKLGRNVRDYEFKDPLPRFMDRIEKPDGDDGCWLWTAAVTDRGYSQMCVEAKKVYVHRWSYEHFVGPIPAGLHIDHTCRVRRCVNPAHLEAVTQAENNRRANSVRVYAKKENANVR